LLTQKKKNDKKNSNISLNLGNPNFLCT